MKKKYSLLVFTFLFLGGSIFLSAQSTWPSLSITSMQVLPTPTFSNNNVKVVSTVSVGHSSYPGTPTISITNFWINIDMCYAEYKTFFVPMNYTDTILIGTLAPGNYSLSLNMLVYAPGSVCDGNNPISAFNTFAVYLGTNLIEERVGTTAVYPNPFTETLVIDGLNKTSMYRFVSLDGKTTNWKQVDSQEISASQLAEGLYFLEILNDEGVFRKKVLKIN